MTQPFSYLDAPSMIGTWLYQPDLSGITPGIKPGLIKYQASVLGLVREGSGYDIVGRSFDLKIDGTTYPVSFSGSGLLSLATVIATINAAVGSDVAKNENGFLRIESTTLGESSFVGVYTDPASSPKDVLYKLGLFPGTESTGGEPTEAPQVDWYKQRIFPRQLSWAEGESISSSAFNRSIFQLALNQDRNHGFLEHKRLAGLKEVSIVMSGSADTFDLVDSVFTGLVGPSPLPDADDLENVVAFLDSNYSEVVIREYINDGAAITGVYSPIGAPGGEGIFFTASASSFSASDATQEKYLVGTHANLGSLSGVPLKIIEYISGTEVRVSNVDSAGDVVTITTTPSISAQKQTLTPWTTRVDSLYDAASPLDRIEKVQKTKVASTTISRIDLNNRVVCAGASFLSDGLLAGDLITISGHTVTYPYSNNGTFRLKAVIDDETLELLGEDWGSVFLNPTGTLGSLVIKTDGDFFYNVRVHLDKTPAAGTYKVIYKSMSTLRGILDSDVGALATAQLRNQEEADDVIERAILAIIGPSTSSISSYLYNDARYSLERAYGLITAEHYAYDESDKPGRHRNVNADSVRIGTSALSSPFDVKDVIRGGNTFSERTPSYANSYFDVGGLSFVGSWPGVYFNSYYNGTTNSKIKGTSQTAYGFQLQDDANGMLRFLYASSGTGTFSYSTSMFFDQDKVGIGTAPLAKLHVGAESTDISTILTGSSSSREPVTAEFRRSNGTLASPTNVASGDVLGELSYKGLYSSSWLLGAQISASVDSAPGSSSMPSRLSFFTSPSGSTTPIERMRIDSSGYVGIGTGSPSSRLEVGANGAADEVITVKSQASVGIQLVGDTDNVDETGGSYLFLSQDGTSPASYVAASLSTTQETDKDGMGNAVTGAVGNDTLLGSLKAYPLKFFTDAAVRMYISSTGYVGVNCIPGTTYRFDVDGLTRVGPLNVRATGGGEGGQIDLTGDTGYDTVALDNQLGNFRILAPTSQVLVRVMSGNDPTYPGYVGIGLGASLPSHKLHVSSSTSKAMYGTSSAGYGVHGVTSHAADEATGVMGVTETPGANYTYGVRGYNGQVNSSGAGVYGQSGGSGTGVGVRGVAAANHGVYGYISHTTADKAAVFGEAVNTGSVQSYGVYGVTSSTNWSGRGVYGRNKGDGSGVHGQAEGSSSSSIGVSGEATATSGAATCGVFGRSYSTDTGSAGVKGQTTTSSGTVYGVNGRSVSASANSSGVRGEAPGSTGIGGYGVHGTASYNHAIFGSSSYNLANYAGVKGENTGTTAAVFGVQGTVASSHSLSAGVYGSATSGVGVLGSSSSGTGLYAVSSTGYGIVAVGNSTRAPIRLTPQSATPTGENGAFFYNSGDNRVYLFANGSWVAWSPVV